MSEYEEITEGYDLRNYEKELQYQLSLGYDLGDSFPAYLVDEMEKLKLNQK